MSAIEEYEKTRAALKLMGELSKGEQSAEEQGWIAISGLEKKLGITDSYDDFSRR